MGLALAFSATCRGLRPGQRALRERLDRHLGLHQDGQHAAVGLDDQLAFQRLVAGASRLPWMFTGIDDVAAELEQLLLRAGAGAQCQPEGVFAR